MPTPKRKPVTYKPVSSGRVNTKARVLESFDYENGAVCPYCGSPVQYHEKSLFIYKSRDLGPVWCCSGWPACNAYVGCHPDSKKPKGPLANSRLRKQRMDAHGILEAMVKVNQQLGVQDARTKTYQLLAMKMNRPTHLTHIGWFNLMEMQHCLNVLNELKTDYGL